jgi:hypothetical protein
MQLSLMTSTLDLAVVDDNKFTWAGTALLHIAVAQRAFTARCSILVRVTTQLNRWSNLKLSSGTDVNISNKESLQLLID